MHRQIMLMIDKELYYLLVCAEILQDSAFWSLSMEMMQNRLYADYMEGM